MSKSKGVALLVGAGDAIGAAVARRFAEGGYRSASQGVRLQSPERSWTSLTRLVAMCRPSVPTRGKKEAFRSFRASREDRWPDRGLFVQRGSQCQVSAIGDYREVFFEPGSLPVMPGFSLAAKQRVTWSTAVVAQFCSPVPRPACEGARDFAAFAVGEIRLAGGCTGDGARTWPEEHSCRSFLIMDGPIDSPEIHRRFMMDKGIDASTYAAGQHDEDLVDCRNLLVHSRAASRWLDS